MLVAHGSAGGDDPGRRPEDDWRSPHDGHKDDWPEDDRQKDDNMEEEFKLDLRHILLMRRYPPNEEVSLCLVFILLMRRFD